MHTYYVLILAAICCGASATVLGGLREADSSDNVEPAVEFATRVINEGLHPASRYLALVPATVHKQVVSGANYQMRVDIFETSCFIYQLGDAMPTIDECPHTKKLSETPCQLVVWDQPWHGSDRFKLSKNECLTTVANAKPMLGDLLSEESFSSFEKTFGKTYKSIEERAQRFEIFKDNMVHAFKLQSHDHGTAVYGPSIFSDLTPEEFKVMLGLRLKEPLPDVSQSEPAQLASKVLQESLDAGAPVDALADIPASWDWRDHNAVTAVKNQGMCGSCWAFSTTGNIEGQWAIKNKNLVPLSEQELLDCDTVDQACNGGLMWDAYQSIIQLGGLDTESDYPYKAEKEDKCYLNKGKVEATISSWTNISTDETEMAKWLQQNGPIAIGINANAMQFYFGGVSHPPSVMCSPSGIDHGVLIVGYGKTWLFKTPYWIVKNSWGASWGEKGYYRVYRGAGVCGLNSAPTSAIV